MADARRLIEVDFPIKTISAHARREKSLRHGPISTLHVWWARRPLAACRAVVLGSLLYDPGDENCPQSFRGGAMSALAVEGLPGKYPTDDRLSLRQALLDFIATFADWDLANQRVYLQTARNLLAAAHPDGPPTVLDPFSGGGAIPLEALRVGAEVYANDLNPVAVLIQRAILEFIPRYGSALVEEVEGWGRWMGEEARSQLRDFYPVEDDGRESVAYLWCRTIRCEGPACGAEIPLIRSLWLSRKGRDSEALRITVSREREISFEIIKQAVPRDVARGTSKGGAATCPVCRFTTPVTSVRKQLRERRGGAHDARLIAVRTDSADLGRGWRLATDADIEAAAAAAIELAKRAKLHQGPLSLVPNEPLPPAGTLGFRVQGYGFQTWGDLYAPRQALILSTLTNLLRNAPMDLEPGLRSAVKTILGLAIDRMADFNASLCVLNSTGGRGLVHVFGRQALPMVWDFMETNPFNAVAASWSSAFGVFSEIAAANRWLDRPATVAQGDARSLPLPAGIANAVITDPPYYDAVPYAALSDFFYVWLRRSIVDCYPDILHEETAPKAAEIIVDPTAAGSSGEWKSGSYFEQEMLRAFEEARRVLAGDGIAVVVFAHKSTAGWEAMLQALIRAGWTVTGSWPIDTERPGRLRAQNSAALASSVHIVCRPRSERASVGAWRYVRPEIERRIAEWLPRLAAEGIEGADSIFACIGPALEVYSSFERVETAAGEQVPLAAPPDDAEAPALLPTVWAAVARTALSILFEGLDAEGFEEDARLTALWLWTFKAASNGTNGDTDDEVIGEGSEGSQPRQSNRGFPLEYDTARKLAQALGAHLDSLDQQGGIVEIRGSSARLRSVVERRRLLMGEESGGPSTEGQLFQPLSEGIPLDSSHDRRTILDRVHLAMLLFGNGRGDALRRLLSRDGYTSEEGFMRLARSLSALYPSSSQEKRWIDGVLATRPR